MLAKKNRANPTIPGAIAVFALALALSGCTPAGPRALLKGKRDLDHGNDEAAVAQLKTATTLLATNAQAWNYYGVALQRAGQPDDAVLAYQRALSLDRDLVEAHYNLGWLWLEQNKPDAARTEFTAYTLRRPNDASGWLELGSAQLHCGETVAAEKSFSTVLYLSTNNAEAFNGLGLARIQRGRPRDAAEFFAAAIQHHPEYAPAYLNLATVSREYLHDNATALKDYRAYLALAPHAADWNDVNALVSDLERPAAAAAVVPPPQETAPPAETRPVPVVPERTYAPKEASAARSHPAYTPPSRPAAEKPVQVEQVPPEPEVVSASQTPVVVTAAPPDVEISGVEPPPAKTSGFWHKVNPARWFASSPPPQQKADENGVTPPASGNLPENYTAEPGSPMAAQSVVIVRPTPPPAPIKIVQPAAPIYPRYTYLSPAKPRSGNRTAAAGEFTRAREFEQDSKWTEAMQAYGQAARYDPGWFAAQYNLGVLSFRLRDYDQALRAYEYALAIQPDSTDARYNFALVLKAAGYVTDAVNELGKIVAAHPGEVRAHLALGNIYAQQLHDVAKARVHYQKVLTLDPVNPQATDIRYWLTANPE